MSLFKNPHSFRQGMNLGAKLVQLGHRDLGNGPHEGATAGRRLQDAFALKLTNGCMHRLLGGAVLLDERTKGWQPVPRPELPLA